MGVHHGVALDQMEEALEGVSVLGLVDAGVFVASCLVAYWTASSVVGYLLDEENCEGVHEGACYHLC